MNRTTANCNRSRNATSTTNSRLKYRKNTKQFYDHVYESVKWYLKWRIDDNVWVSLVPPARCIFTEWIVWADILPIIKHHPKFSALERIFWQTNNDNSCICLSRFQKIVKFLFFNSVGLPRMCVMWYFNQLVQFLYTGKRNLWHTAINYIKPKCDFFLHSWFLFLIYKVGHFDK